MNEELVEKVARAICEEDHKGGDFGMMGIDAWEEPRGREVYIARARAALSVIREALSEPTPAMLGAAWNADELHCKDLGIPSLDQFACGYDHWKAMIAASPIGEK